MKLIKTIASHSTYNICEKKSAVEGKNTAVEEKRSAVGEKNTAVEEKNSVVGDKN